MKKILVFILLTTLALSFAQEKYVMEGEKRFKNIKMLTEVGENAEAYFSFDGKKVIYQSTVGDLKCDQIFTMNLDGSNKQMVSTGNGRTTCAYYYPDGDKILYASTHHFNKDCPPPPGRSKGYVWKLYDEFDIFMANSDGPEIVQLTSSGKYDAEATISPKGDKIVFTSTRDGDPELYLMNLDGSEQTRLTYEKGYDGGAFFSADGSKIVFRASRPKTEKELEDYNELVNEGLVRPTNLEIFVMDADGKNMKQVTDLKAASFAPFFHPDGKELFSLLITEVKIEENSIYLLLTVYGTGLEQFTYNPSFDGFPMFSPDGKYLIFGSNRFNKNPNDTNIFIAEWIDDINQEKGY